MMESTIPTLQWLRNKIEQLYIDLLHEIVQSVTELLMSYELTPWNAPRPP